MHDARGRDNLVRRIALEIQAGRRKRHLEVDRPYVDPVQDASDVPVFEIHLDASELGKRPRHCARLTAARTSPEPFAAQPKNAKSSVLLKGKRNAPAERSMPK